MRSTSFPGLWLMLSVKDFKSTQKHCFSKQYDTLTIIACEQALARRVGPWLVGPRRNWLRVNWHLTCSEVSIDRLRSAHVSMVTILVIPNDKKLLNKKRAHFPNLLLLKCENAPTVGL